MFGDCSATVSVGDVDKDSENLINVCELALKTAISKCKPGQPLSVIPETCTQVVKNHGFNIFPQFCGHFISDHLHIPPFITHSVGNDAFYKNLITVFMEVGQVFTIEPVICKGNNTEDVVLLEDGWRCDFIFFCTFFHQYCQV
jgi:methionine aminopeptidase